MYLTGAGTSTGLPGALIPPVAKGSGISVTGSVLRLVDHHEERESAQDRTFSGPGRHGVWEAHHAERIEQPPVAGENQNEKCYLKG